MASSGKKCANWTNAEDEKLLDVLIEQLGQGMVKFDWNAVRAVLRTHGIQKDSAQIKNHFMDLGKKLRAWEYLMGKTGVGVDPTTGAVVVTDDVWREFLQQYNGKFKSFRRRPPAHVEKLRMAFHGRHATGEMSFSPGIVASQSNVKQRMKGLVGDTQEHVGDSDDGDSGGTPDDVDLIAPAESCSPPKTMSFSRKRKSGGGMSSGSKRQAGGGNSGMDEEVSNALHILRMREEGRQKPLLSQQVSARLRNHPEIGHKAPEFVFRILHYIVTQKQEEYFLGLDDDFVVPYVRLSGFDV